MNLIRRITVEQLPRSYTYDNCHPHHLWLPYCHSTLHQRNLQGLLVQLLRSQPPVQEGADEDHPHRSNFTDASGNLFPVH